MATQPLIPHKITVKEYLATVYRPDCDYVDGEVQERNLGEIDHSRLQRKILVYLSRFEQIGTEAFPEQRVQVSPTRFRIPDVCVILGEPDGQILRKPPFLCIEVPITRRPHEPGRATRPRLPKHGRPSHLGRQSPNQNGPFDHPPPTAGARSKTVSCARTIPLSTCLSRKSSRNNRPSKTRLY
ncbi:MAG: Uma2 family endonuclease [Acidobacteriota bacterium]